ncbi:MAG TPA: polysaccharide biosynthesis/export family protein [Gemmataceae bacterium]|jgi:polysaccharide export outer membrane protein
MHTRPTYPRRHAALLAGLIALAGGCYHTDAVVIPPPPDGAVPTELAKVVLPRYVIEAPDLLYVQVLQAPYTHYLPSKEQNEEIQREAIRKEADAAKARGDAPAQRDAERRLAELSSGVMPPIEPRAYFSNPLTPVPIDGQHLVQMDGTIDLGIYGSVQVSGLTPDQARERIREFLLQVTNRKPDTLQVRVAMLAYNSKQYYIITDGAGYGEQVAAFPVTGSETVLDAMARVGGLPQVSSKREIWIARRSPHGGPDQILPVCWEDITKRGISATNYQVLPGDRIYVESQKIIKVDNWLAKFLQPVERVFGVILLGSETVNSIKGSTTTGAVR